METVLVAALFVKEVHFVLTLIRQILAVNALKTAYLVPLKTVSAVMETVRHEMVIRITIALVVKETLREQMQMLLNQHASATPLIQSSVLFSHAQIEKILVKPVMKLRIQTA